jgi:hypothetical protein
MLRDNINAVLADSIFIPTQASIKIISLDSNNVLYERASKMLMRPASNIHSVGGPGHSPQVPNRSAPRHGDE